MSNRNETEVIARPGAQDILISREFDAPRELVFEAFTDPSLYAQWMGPRRMRTYIRKFDAHNGGQWRILHVDTDGTEYRLSGVFHEVTRPYRIVNTFEFEGVKKEQNFVTLEFSTFEVLPYGRTLYSAQSLFQSERTRDEEWESGMREGMFESFDRLDELLENMQANQPFYP